MTSDLHYWEHNSNNKEFQIDYNVNNQKKLTT